MARLPQTIMWSSDQKAQNNLVVFFGILVTVDTQSLDAFIGSLGIAAKQ